MILSINFYFSYNLFKIVVLFLKKSIFDFFWPPYFESKKMTAADFVLII